MSVIPRPLIQGSFSKGQEQPTHTVKYTDISFLEQHFLYMHVKNYYTMKPNIALSADADFVKHEA